MMIAATLYVVAALGVAMDRTLMLSDELNPELQAKLPVVRGGSQVGRATLRAFIGRGAVHCEDPRPLGEVDDRYSRLCIDFSRL